MEYIKTYLDISIIAILGVMSFLMLWFVIERWLYYRNLDLPTFSQADALQVALTKHLTLISSVGANAPYVGLLGTVFGIMITFYDIGNSGAVDTQSIMLGLALALKATAMGLFVAIPAIIFYNGLLRRVDVLTADWKVLQEQAGA